MIYMLTRNLQAMGNTPRLFILGFLVVGGYILTPNDAALAGATKI